MGTHLWSYLRVFSGRFDWWGRSALNVGGTLQWTGVPDWRGSRAQASILHLSLLPESGCRINSCLTLLLPQLPSPPHPCREEPYLQLWAKNKPSPWVAFATYFIPVMRKLINQPLGKIQTSTMRTHPMLQPNRQQVLQESRETKTHTCCGKEVNGVGAVANRSADSPNTNYSYCMTQKFQTYTCAQKK